MSLNLTTGQPAGRITIAVLALGGQGGGVLANWIGAVAREQGYFAQATSVPGVAQRTGSTIYYIELAPETPDGREPILALAPAPGDIDVVIASELMEAGRAMVRGFVSPDRTALLSSTHRIYAISEKTVRGDGAANGDAVLTAAAKRAKVFVGFDMQAAADKAGSVISAVMFGALARAGALPFAREAYENAIRAEGKAVEPNLRGFTAGWDGAGPQSIAAPAPAFQPPEPTTQKGQAIRERILATLPAPSHAFAMEGARRLMDYQDFAYAESYLDRLISIAALDSVDQGWRLTMEAARHLALWMSYDDTIRVADLKIRRDRMERLQSEVKALPDQLVEVTEFMHPRLQEIAETLPAALGRWLLRSKWVEDSSRSLFEQGRFVKTTSIGWFVALWVIASMRPWRRGTLRFQQENARIEQWLAVVAEAARHADMETAVELVRCQALIKGYGDTHERGLRNFSRAMNAYAESSDKSQAAAAVRKIRDAILASAEDDQPVDESAAPVRASAFRPA